MLLVEQLGEVIPGERDSEAPREVARTRYEVIIARLITTRKKMVTMDSAHDVRNTAN